MFSLFIVLLGFKMSAKCLFLNDEPYMVKPYLIDMGPNELKYYQFMISLSKFAGHLMSYFPKYVFQNKQKTQLLKHLIDNKQR